MAPATGTSRTRSGSGRRLHGVGRDTCTNTETGFCWAIPNNANCDGAPTIGVGFGACPNGPTTCTSSYLEYCPAVLEGDFYAICL